MENNTGRNPLIKPTAKTPCERNMNNANENNEKTNTSSFSIYTLIAILIPLFFLFLAIKGVQLKLTIAPWICLGISAFVFYRWFFKNKKSSELKKECPEINQIEMKPIMNTLEATTVDQIHRMDNINTDDDRIAADSINNTGMQSVCVNTGKQVTIMTIGPSKRILLFGQEKSGKTTIVTAIKKYLAINAELPPDNTSYYAGKSGCERCSIVDATFDEAISACDAGNISISTAIVLVVDPENQIMPQVNKQLSVVKKYQGNPAAVIISKCDQVYDDDLLDLAEHEIRELFEQYGFNKNIAIVHGYAELAVSSPSKDPEAAEYGFIKKMITVIAESSK